MSTFDAFKAAHAGTDFEDYAAFVKAMDEAGLEGEDRQRAYSAWRLGWSRATLGAESAELKEVRRGRIKRWV
ncbi:hypothetical protein ACFELO_06350 [Oceanicaulis sp. LC35]|uniref:hypothetical protein n=1 Tax=Oceanicaulis sp. LC35 TaxID=3349635 RepID=UPI003F854E0D